VNALAEKFSNSKVLLDGQAISNGCFGLQRLDPNDPSTKKLIDMLVDKMEQGGYGELTAQVIGNVLVNIKDLLEEDRIRILKALKLPTYVTINDMSALENTCKDEIDMRLMYSQYLAYVLANYPERGLKEMEILAQTNKIQSIIEDGKIDCHRHVPSTAVALVSHYLSKESKSERNQQKIVIVGQSKGEHWNAEHRRIRPAIESWLHNNGYSFFYDKGRLFVDLK
jgi:hypothetical protein